MSDSVELTWHRRLLRRLRQEGTAIVMREAVSGDELRRAVVAGRSFASDDGSYVVTEDTLIARAERAEAEVARLREALRECVHVHNGTHSEDCHAFGAGSDEDLDPEATSPDPHCDCGATAKRESFRAALADSEKEKT